MVPKSFAWGLEALGVPAVGPDVSGCNEVWIRAPLLLATHKYKDSTVISPLQQWGKRSGPNLRFSAHSVVCGGYAYAIYRRKVRMIL